MTDIFARKNTLLGAEPIFVPTEQGAQAAGRGPEGVRAALAARFEDRQVLGAAETEGRAQGRTEAPASGDHTVRTAQAVPQAVPDAPQTETFSFDAVTGGTVQTAAIQGPSTGLFTDTGQSVGGTSQSYGMDLGDVDGDGDLDWVVANYSGNKVWLNNGTGTFTDSGQSLGSDKSLDVELADLDGDGDLDMIEAISGSGNKVWINDGTGSFTDSGQTLGAALSYHVDLGDIDGDGDIDMVVANFGQANAVWLNDGSGTFTDSGQSLGSLQSLTVELGDLDGDGDLDMVVGNFNQGNTVWLNAGTGQYTDTGQSLGTANSYDVALGDVDGDGDLDMVVANYAGAANTVWLNDGTGQFTDSGQTLGTGFSWAAELGDLDGNCSLDIAVTNVGQADKVYLGAAAPIISNLDGDRVTYTQGLGAVLVDARDTGTDAKGMTPLIAGLSDLDSPDMDSGSLTVSVVSGGSANEDGLTFDETVVSLTSGKSSLSLGTGVIVDGNVIGTVTGIGRNGEDLVIVFNGSATPARVEMLVQAIAYVNSATLPDVTPRTLEVTVADGDGGSTSAEVTVSIQTPASGTLTDSGQTLGGSSAGYDVALGDIDGDGDLDLVASKYGSGNQVFLNDGTGDFLDTGQALGSGSTISLGLGDVDGDGDLDMVAGNYGQGNTVWLNDGSGTFTDSGQSLGSNNTYKTLLADVDGDGDLDMVEAVYGAGNRVWLNNGAGIFTDSGQSLGFGTTTDIALGDVDGDGDIDMVVADSGAATTVWLNDGSGNFANTGFNYANTNAYAVVLGDIDGDGDLDMVVGNSNGANTVWLNDGSGLFANTGQTFAGTSDTYDLEIVDIDGDGENGGAKVGHGSGGMSLLRAA